MTSHKLQEHLMNATSNRNLAVYTSSMNLMTFPEVGDGVCHPRHRGRVCRHDLILKEFLNNQTLGYLLKVDQWADNR